MVIEGQRRIFESRREALDPKFEELRKILLEIGGEEVVPLPEPNLEKLIEEGEVFDGKVKYVEGATNQCHENVLEMYRSDDGDGDICTGWGLTRQDALWRQHSWFLSSEERIMETTTPRHVYYGVVLKGLDLDWFVVANTLTPQEIQELIEEHD